MTRLAVTFPDIERVAIGWLIDELDDGDTTIGLKLPAGWTTTSPNHLTIRCDGTPTMAYPVMARATIRATAWSASPTEAKALVMKAQGVLCSYPGGDNVSGITALTGMLPAYDPDHEAELAAITCRAVLRSIPIVAGS